jgi:hypothetical protein
MQTLRLGERFALLAPYAPAAAILVGVVIAQVWALPGNDVAWLLTLAEKLLAGARPDIDFIEFNPPAAYLVYVPAAAIGHLLRIKSDLVLIVMTIAAVLVSICAAGWILTRANLLGRREWPVMITGAIVALLVFADEPFAQREHLAVIALLPMLAIYASRSAVATPSNLTAILCGVGGGLAICIKPYFGLALVPPLFFLGWRTRTSVKALVRLVFSPENIAAAAVVAVYCAAILFLFQDYLRITLPIVISVYLPVREPLFAMLTGMRFVIFVLMLGAALVVGKGEIKKPIPAVLCLAALGFLLAMAAQARTWFYQGYPALALLMIATTWLALQRATRLRDVGRARRAVSFAIVGVSLIPSIAALFITHVAWLTETTNIIRLTERIRPLARAHPSVIAIARTYAFITVARRLDGDWVGRTYFQIITLNVDEQFAMRRLSSLERARLDAYARYDAAILASDIKATKPDLVLLDGIDRSWALSERPVIGALHGYRDVGFFERVFVWVPDVSKD